MNIIGLLDRPTAGIVRLAGETIDHDSADAAAHTRNRLLGFVFQSFNLLPRLTAWENVALPLLYRGTPRRDRKPRALEMLGQVGLGDRADHRPGRLVGRTTAARRPRPRADRRTQAGARRRADRKPGQRHGRRGHGLAARPQRAPRRHRADGHP